jgi:Icc protein
MSKLRLAFVTDIHHGADYGTKLGQSALPLVQRFRNWCAAESPDLAIEMGDRINNVAHDPDMHLSAEVGAAFAGFPVGITHLLGNHDCHALTVQEAEAAVRQSLRSHSRERNGFHLVFWNANVHKHAANGYVASQADLDWLARDLASTDLPSVVCSHVPLDGGSMVGNLYFEKGSSAGHGGYANSEAARAIIEASGKVVLCVAGHTHWNALSIVDGTVYVTVPSLSEGFMSWPNPAAAWAGCELDQDIRIRIYGEAPAEYRLPMRKLGQHWVSRFKDYAPKPPSRLGPEGH